MDLQQSLEQLLNSAIDFAPKLVMAILTLIVGFWIIGKIIQGLSQILRKREFDINTSNFLLSVAGVALKIMLIFSVVSMIGINTTSFVAIFGALMVGVGMALNGTIGHFASGVMLMIFKPFKVGDLITIGGGETGTVLGINAFNTTLSTLDNRKIIIANSNITSNTITNISGQGVIGVELTFGIGYNDSIDKARAVILKVFRGCPTIIDNPSQDVVVSGHGDSAIELFARPFCKSTDYWNTKFYVLEHVKKEFDKAGIGIPYPQMDVHMIAQH